MSGGVGTELRKMIPKLFEHTGCKCSDYARRYDAWGIRKCEQRKRSIVATLVNKASRDKYAKYFPQRITRAVAERWVDTAIARAKQNAKR